ncbi:acyl carrier protein phosphodiesterase [Ichthyenterobacterium magnum]|uniref:Acyl carrier protein phosphodiesterase n=1 Tax=Ichthyenterobacterium magnum TaxID=1230530 RepID=A0A420DKS0_9FLAO|nr:acyl carrier protein phosphodiesterase [Ichthyenterobacterium magnum]RKE94856.1 acyl carrier protein phosphodiesterase [Ichthyenterobacterium magnum]
MNFLAHIYLSGNNNMITIGNFIADGIRGKHYKKYPKDIQIGILLHRQIDTFTDAHPIVRQSTKRLHENYSHYSGVIVDILYDHYLAKNWKHYSKIPLEKYVDDFYDSLEDNYELLPLRIQKMMPYMIADNWLLSYSKIEGIQRVLNGMNRRTKNISKMNEATKELKLYYSEFEKEFTNFFKELEAFTQQQLIEITKTFND